MTFGAYICDPACIDEQGHHWDLSLKYQRLIQKQGINPSHLVSTFAKREDLCKHSSASIIGLFTHNLYGQGFAIKDINRVTEADSRRLLDYIKKCGHRRNLLIFHTLTIDTVLMIQQLIDQVEKDFQISFLCVTPYTNDIPAGFCEGLFWDRIRSLLEVQQENIYVKVCGENPMLSIELSKYIQMPVDTFHIPFDIPEEHSIEDQSRVIGIGYVGGARKERGFHRLPKIIAEINSYFSLMESPKKLLFRINYSLPRKNKGPFINATLEKLESISNVVILNEYLDWKDYSNFLSELDFVLCPYDKNAYTVRGSGMPLDAMRAEAALIAPFNTSMEYSTLSAHSSFFYSEMDIPKSVYNNCLDIGQLRNELRAQNEAVRRYLPLLQDSIIRLAIEELVPPGRLY